MANITTPNTTGVAMRLPLPLVARLTVDGKSHNMTASQYAATLIASHYGDASFVPSAKHTTVVKSDAQIRAERKSRRDARKQRTADALAALAKSLTVTPPKS